MFSCEQVDWNGKVALIQCAKAMGIQKFVFFSIHNCEKHPEVPLMEIKRCTEKYIADSGLNYTIVRLCGFMQVKNKRAYNFLRIMKSLYGFWSLSQSMAYEACSVSGLNWSICCTYTGRQVSLGNRCFNTDRLHGHPGAFLCNNVEALEDFFYFGALGLPSI